MGTKLTMKQNRFVKDYIKTGNATQAALNNYDIKAEDKLNVAGAIGSELLTVPKVAMAIEEALPQETLYEIHREGLFASKPFFNEAGEKVSEEADFSVRHKYLDTAYKLKGSYAPDKHVTVNITAEPSDRIKQIANELNNAKRRNTGGDN